LMIGGGQEAGQRSGTENMAGIAAFGAVLAALEEGSVFRSHAEMTAMRDRLAAALREAFPGIVFNAPLAHALPTTLNFAVPGMPSKELLDVFDAAGLRVSAGSACSAAKAAPSYVLAAMGLPLWCSSGAVRLSFGPLATQDFIDEACARIRRCGQALRGAALAPSPLSGARNGLLQVSSEGRHGWIAFDLDAGVCVAIDPPAPLAPRIAALAGEHGLRMTAVLGTGADPDGAAARAALRAALGQASADPGALGWPASEAALTLGGRTLTRLAADGTRVHYLLETTNPTSAQESACVAFSGDADGEGVPAHAALLCHAVDIGGLPLRVRGDTAGDGAAAQLSPAALEEFLRTHADALLVDVREPAEAAVGVGTCRLHGRAALNVPLSRLAEHMDLFLTTPRRRLLFVCRSGNRSARAALALRRAGHDEAWTLAGGLALANV